MNRILALVAVAAVAVIGALVWQSTRPEATGVPLGAVGAQEAAEIDTSMIEEMSLGNPDAEVTVIEYASFTCPHCRTFHAGPFKELKADYIDTGKIHFIYREVYFDQFALWAGMIARCGGEDRYFGLVDLLYERQGEWAQGDPQEIVENLKDVGKVAGLTQEQVDGCLARTEENQDLARAMVALYQQNATEDGIDSTPSFVINGTKYTNMGFDDFSRILDEELGS